MARPARGGCRLLILLEPLVSFTELVNQVTAVQGSFTPITDSCLKMKINKLNLVLLDMLDTVLCGHDLNKAFLFSYAKQNFFTVFIVFTVGGVVALWIVHSPSDQAVWVWSPAGDIML